MRCSTKSVSLDRRHSPWRDDDFGVAQQKLLQPIRYPPQELVAVDGSFTAMVQQLAKLGRGDRIGDNGPANARSFAPI